MTGKIDVDVGGNGSIDWTVTNASPKRIASGNLAAAITAFMASKTTDTVDVPITIKSAKVGQLLLVNVAGVPKPQADLSAASISVAGARSIMTRGWSQVQVYYDAAAGLLKDTGIKTKIIKQYLPIINKLVNKYLASFDFFVNFNLDESFKETIKSRHRDDFTYASFSEGEKQKIDLALLFSWRAVAKLKNSANTNLLILDEVFDSSLDANGTEYLMTILQMLEGTNVFVISHKGDILQDKFRSVIRFEKVKNFSRIMK
jgi:hypothetical protein